MGVEGKDADEPREVGRDARAQSRGPSEDGAEAPKTGGFATSRVTDPVDAEYSGDVPAYAEVRSASVRDLGRRTAMVVVFDAPLPVRMDRDTVMTVELKIEGRRGEVAVYAEGEDDGWEGYSQRPRAEGPKPDLSIEGSTLTLTLPQAALVPAPFGWVATMSWAQGTLTDTYYAFDTAPNHGRARHP